MALLAPSLLSARFLHLADDCKMLNESEADWYHLDVMDGHFVPNISFGPMFIDIFRKSTKKICDVHLMITEPDKYIDLFKKAGADILTVHIEACTHAHRSLTYIRSLGIKAGVALNPHTSIEQIKYLLPNIDLICVMGVNPGFGGQTFIPQTIQKLKDIKAMVQASGYSIYIEIDGGVTIGNVQSIVEAGASVVVAGSAIFQTPAPIQTIQTFKKIMDC